jgi:hypothetical protein
VHFHRRSLAYEALICSLVPLLPFAADSKRMERKGGPRRLYSLAECESRKLVVALGGPALKLTMFQARWHVMSRDKLWVLTTLFADLSFLLTRAGLSRNSSSLPGGRTTMAFRLGSYVTAVATAKTRERTRQSSAPVPCIGQGVARLLDFTVVVVLE